MNASHGIMQDAIYRAMFSKIMQIVDTNVVGKLRQLLGLKTIDVIWILWNLMHLKVTVQEGTYGPLTGICKSVLVDITKDAQSVVTCSAKNRTA
ncbi:uncharacterized protein LOC111519352 isoform X3 [Drosophila willistoni]|uniref:uncharacterized protein LOC111519352 isoform X3 n=1 Tax=Drosophila willistoni TaxID=7260 RepID=UPI001F07CA51|nr:uncharacterized protein LOC111519352 isoform X3 [Drosophila willistoni]